MKLLTLRASRYRSLREETISLKNLNLFIGPNGSGKSTILDALRFLQEGVQGRDFGEAVSSRGGIIHLAWKGEEARRLHLIVSLGENGRSYEWSVRLNREGFAFSVDEEVNEVRAGSPPSRLLIAEAGKGWWWSGEKQVQLAQSATGCALSAAAADATFPARHLAQFVSGWRFFDPNSFSLRRSWPGLESSRLDSYGRNLAERLHALNSSPKTQAIFNQIVSATQSVLGLPTKIEPRESEGRFYFAQEEPGLLFPVHQIGASSGTLRMLALMTALLEDAGSNLVGIEEPENHVHPTALTTFAQYLLKAQERVQILVTTHSPLLLDSLNDPVAVCVVRRSDEQGTRVVRETAPEAVQQALEASGFGLGEFYETKGFGG